MNQVCKDDIWVENSTGREIKINWLTPPQPIYSGYTSDWSVTFSSNSPNIHDMTTMERVKFLLNFTFIR